jgi:hypothetical protein
MPVARSRDTQGPGLGNWLAQKVNERVSNARVPDAGRGEKELHGASPLDRRPLRGPEDRPGKARRAARAVDADLGRRVGVDLAAGRFEG